MTELWSPPSLPAFSRKTSVLLNTSLDRAYRYLNTSFEGPSLRHQGAPVKFSYFLRSTPTFITYFRYIGVFLDDAIAHMRTPFYVWSVAYIYLYTHGLQLLYTVMYDSVCNVCVVTRVAYTSDNMYPCSDCLLPVVNKSPNCAIPVVYDSAT